MSIDENTLSRIEAALSKTGLYVDPSLTEQLSPQTQAQLRLEIAKMPTPVYVVAIKVGYDDPLYSGRPELLFGTIHSDTGQDGVYLGTDLNGEPAVRAQSFGSAPDAFYATAVARTTDPGDIGKQLLKTLELVRTGTGQQEYERLQAREGSTSSSAQSSSPGSSGGESSSAGVAFSLGGVLVLVLAAVAVAIVRRRRRGVPPGSGHVTDRPFELPSSVLSKIRATQDRQLEKRANNEVLALGERIDATDLTTQADSDAWLAALDHYDLARRILERKHSAADVVGSIVLTERGEAALSAAVRGASYEPVRPCYLNPLHGPGVRSTTLKGDRGGMEVPMCASCSRDVEAGREPRGVLDFVTRGKPRHYFDIDVEPWRSTGYGALDPDLVTRLFTQP